MQDFGGSPVIEVKIDGQGHFSQRLKRLEARVLPTGDPMVMRIVFIDSDGGETASSGVRSIRWIGCQPMPES